MPFECIKISEASSDNEFTKMDILNVKNFGAIGDGVNNDLSAIQSAVSSAANKVLYFPPGVYLVNNNLTIGSNVKVEMANGARFKLAFGKVLTINGPFEAGLHQVFEDVNGCTNGGFDSSTGWTVGSGWTISDGVATHTAGNTGTLSFAGCAGVNGKTFIVKYTIGGTPNGGLIASIGGASGFRRSSAGTYYEFITATGTDALTFTPETNFGGTLDNVEVYMLETHVFGAGSVDKVIPQWWGAKGDDSTECAYAFNKALSTITSVGTLYIPAGTYRLSFPIMQFPKTNNGLPSTGLKVQGAGMSYSVLKYMGNDDNYAIVTANDLCFPMSYSGSCSFSVPNYITFCDFQIQAPYATASGGGFRLSAGRQRHERISYRYIPNGTALRITRSNTVYYDTGHANDTDVELTSSGSGTAEKVAIKFRFNCFSDAPVRSVKVRLKKLGNPAGTIQASIYSDNSGVPGTQINAGSSTVNCSSLSTNTDGGEVTFTFYYNSSSSMPPEVSHSTDYWLVLSTSGYTNDASNKVYIRAKTSDTTNGFAVYNYGTGSWTTNNNGSDLYLHLAVGQALQNYLDYIHFGKTDSNGVKTSVLIEDDCQAVMSNCDMLSDNGMLVRGNVLVFVEGSEISCASDGLGVHVIGEDNCSTWWQSTFLEGGGTDGNGYYFDGGRHFFSSISGGWYPSWTAGTKVIMDETMRAQYPQADDPSFRINSDIIRVAGDNEIQLTNNAVVEADTDSDALGSYRIKLSNATDGIIVGFGNKTNEVRKYLPRGVYLITVYAKDTNQVANNLTISSGMFSGSTLTQTYTLTSQYKPYHFILHLGSSEMVYDSRRFSCYKTAAATNTIYISHVEIKYLGQDKASAQWLVANNPVGSDSDSARETGILFLGRRTPSDGSDKALVAPLAIIRASHDGTSRDEKGKLEIAVNDGDDKFNPSKVIRYNSGGVLSADNLILTGRDAVTSNTYRFVQSAMRALTSPRLILSWVSSDMTTESDLSGNGNNGTYYGSPTANTVKHQTWIFSPDGSNDRLQIADSDTLSFGDGTNDSPFSVLAFVNVVDRSVGPVIISKYDTTSGATKREWWLYLDSSEQPTLRLYDESAGAYIGRRTSSAVSLGWHFIAATYDGTRADTGIKLYVDGVLASTATSSSGSYVAMENTDTPVNIACYKNGASSYTSWWNTYIGPIIVEGSELSAKAIWEIYLLGRAYLGI